MDDASPQPDPTIEAEIAPPADAPAAELPVWKHVVYTKELAEYICDQICAGRTIVAICREDPGMPHRHSVAKWLAREPEFERMHSFAIGIRAEVYADEIIAITDAPFVSREDTELRKLKLDARKWNTSRLLRSRYGDRDMDHSGSGGMTLEQLVLQASRERIRALPDPNAPIDVVPTKVETTSPTPAQPSQDDASIALAPEYDNSPLPPNTIRWGLVEPAPMRPQVFYDPFQET